jgi:hypothetical protein
MSSWSMARWSGAPRRQRAAGRHQEPDTSAGLRLMLKLFGPLAPDQLL